MQQSSQHQRRSDKMRMMSKATMALFIILNACEIIAAKSIADDVAMQSVESSPTSLPSSSSSLCKTKDGMWGDVDPNIFYMCDAATNKPIQFKCPEGRGFFNGMGFYGCIPYESWPACLEVIEQKTEPDCTQQQQQQEKQQQYSTEEPWPAINPNKFYMCHENKSEPSLISCGSGRGFVSARQSTNATVLGCALWEKWRQYMNCEQFY